jgi:hypothetical protein
MEVTVLSASDSEKIDQMLTEMRDLRVDVAVIRQRVDSHDTTGSDVERRIRALEAWRWQQVGIATTAGGATGTITALIGYLITR